MEVVLFDQNTDKMVLDQVFPEDIRRISTEYLGAVGEDGELRGVASLGYEQDTIILQYIFVPVKYRWNGVGTALLDDISERLFSNTNSYLEAYFDESDDLEGLRGLFLSRTDYHLEDNGDYGVAYWLGLPNHYLEGRGM